MHACGFKTVSICIRSGGIILSKLDVPQGRHALDIIAVGLVTGLLDWLLSRGEYEKVIRCDICIPLPLLKRRHTLVLTCTWFGVAVRENIKCVKLSRFAFREPEFSILPSPKETRRNGKPLLCADM